MPRRHSHARERRSGNRFSRSLYRDLNLPDPSNVPPIYGRVCSTCGHLELSDDELLFVEWRECPSCTAVRSGGEHGRVH